MGSCITCPPPQRSDHARCALRRAVLRVFARLVTVLADIGYDASNVFAAPYDW